MLPVMNSVINKHHLRINNDTTYTSSISKQVHNVVLRVLKHYQRQDRVPIKADLKTIQELHSATKYMDSSIATAAEKSLTRQVNWRITTKVRNDISTSLMMHLIYPASIPSQHVQFIMLISELCVNVVISFANPTQLKDHIRGHNMSVKILMTDAKKHLCTESSICKLHPINVNSGVTISSMNRIEVVVYRSEEVFKVLLHELIHAFGLDFAFTSSHLENVLKKQYSTNSPLFVNESFTDTWGCLLNACLFSSLYAICFKKEPINVFDASLSIESSYIISKGTQMQRRVDETIERIGSYEEGTHVISYYILKSHNFMRLEEFLRRFSRKHNNGIWIQHDDFVDYVEWLIDDISELPIKDNLIPQQKHSMRMSKLDCMAFIKCFKNKLLKTIVV